MENTSFVTVLQGLDDLDENLDLLRNRGIREKRPQFVKRLAIEPIVSFR